MVVPAVALQTGMLVWVDALNSRCCMGGCLTVESLWEEVLWKQDQVNFCVYSVGASVATLGTVRLVAVFSVCEIRRQINFLCASLGS